MKKTISITLGGLLFLIEEDGYELLRQYLDQVHKYFASYKDSREIIADIESRIAELFLEAHPDRKESITLDDVSRVVKTLGSVADFAAEEDETVAEPAQSSSSQSSTDSQTAGSADSGSQPWGSGLRRNMRHKLIGGVCAGIALYLNVASIWVRLVFLVLLVGFAWIPPVSGLATLLYVALWISMPGAYMDESRTARQFFRSRKNKVIGGVCAGLAQYFNIDVSVIRLLGIISLIAFGSGFLFYILMWMATPLASSLTDEMKMSGTPINLASIENTVKRNLEPENQSSESSLTKLILLPFRLVGTLLRGLGPVASALLRGMSVIIGLFIIVICLIITFGLFMISMAAAGIVEWASIVHIDEIPVTQVFNHVPDTLINATALAVFIPVVVALLGAMRLVFNRPSVPNYVYMVLFGFWIVSVGWLSVAGVNFFSQFSEDAEVVRTVEFPLTAKNLDIKMGLSDEDARWASIELEFDQWDGDSIKVVRTFEATGKTVSDAARLTESILHNVRLVDSTLIIDGRFEIDSNDFWRDQKVKVKVIMPRNVTFTVDRNFTTNLSRMWWEGSGTNTRLHYGKFKFSGDTLTFKDLKSDEPYIGFTFKDENGNFVFKSLEDQQEETEDNLKVDSLEAAESKAKGSVD